VGLFNSWVLWGLLAGGTVWVAYRQRDTMKKPILCLDFDGVIHSYSSGWKGARNIPDPPVDGALEFMLAALPNWDVVIHSSRGRYLGGIRAMRNWLYRHALKAGVWYETGLGVTDGLEQVRFSRWKPSALITIDDRALTFDGTWPELKSLKEFKPWNKRNSK
jgi:hypothetical protein